MTDATLEAAPAQYAWEMGSDFHWDVTDLCRADALANWLPARHSLFSSFTGAFRRLLELLPGNPVVHLPSYFWMGMVGLLEPYAEIKFYREIPDGCGPDLDSVSAGPGDVVLAVNCFGRADRSLWDDWATEHDRVSVIEDHTHDPLSGWARTSTADYCIASLRKTMPVPDGALVWSPRGGPLPEPGPGVSQAADIKMSAMLLKAAWLQGKGIRKDDFRACQVSAERTLSAGTFGPTAFTAAVLPAIDVFRLRSARVANVRRLVDGLTSRDCALAPLTHSAGLDVAPFNAQVMCETRQLRDSARAYLADHHVYTPVHWRHPWDGFGGDDARAVDIGDRIMTIPVDHRYSTDDVDRVLDVIDGFVP